MGVWANDGMSARLIRTVINSRLIGIVCLSYPLPFFPNYLSLMLGIANFIPHCTSVHAQAIVP